MTDFTFTGLTPDIVLDALEACGIYPQSGLLALNSYENRVYRVGLENNISIIVKFYRSERWNNSEILEEHEFSNELVNNEVPVIAPIPDRYGDTLRYYESYRFALFKN